MGNLTKEFEYYKSHQAEIVGKYKNKHVVIKGEKVIGAYDSYEEAVVESMKDHKLGTFLVQQVQSGKGNFTQTFHSRVVLT